MAPETILVVAAVASDGGRYLLGLRPVDKRHGGMWEFPGGKLGPDETDEMAMTRELGEELAVGVRRFGALMFEARDPGSPFVIRFFDVTLNGAPSALEHTRLGWFTPLELTGMPLAPSDALFVRDVLLG